MIKNLSPSPYIQNLLSENNTHENNNDESNSDDWEDTIGQSNSNKEETKEVKNTNNTPEMNVLGKAGEYVEDTARSWYTWVFGKSPQTPIQKDEEDCQETVIMTNWYWKQQIRILRFEKTVYKRIHPKTLDVKQTHKYKDIKLINISGNTIFKIHYGDINPDYYESINRDKILHEFTTRKQKKKLKHVISIVKLELE